MEELKPENYCLDRFDLLLDPSSHASIYAGRKELISRLKKRIDRSYRTGSAMHTLLWGPYGAGKTHTLYYLVNYIKEQGYDADIRHLSCPSFETGSVVELYRAIIMSLGQKFLYDLIEKVWTAVYPRFDKEGAKTDADKIELIDQRINHRDLASVILAYQKPVEGMKYIIWKWFGGEKCSTKEKQLLGVITDNSRSTDAIHTLLSVIYIDGILKDLEKRKTLLVLMIDELEQLKPLGTAQDFIELFRRLAEYKTLFVMLLAYTAAAAEEVPVISAPPVRQRFGFPENYISIPVFDPLEAKEFIADLFTLLRPKDVNIAQKVKKAAETTDENVSEKFYPFTEEAVEAILTKISASGEPPCPRNIEMTLTSTIGNALTQDKPPLVITSDLIL